MSNNTNESVEVYLDIQDPAALPDSVREALQNLSAAIADEEVALTDEMLAQIQADDEVAGFNFGTTIPIGRLPTGGPSKGPIGTDPIVTGWCIFKGSSSEGNPCGVYSRGDSEGPSESCTFYFV